MPLSFASRAGARLTHRQGCALARARAVAFAVAFASALLCVVVSATLHAQTTNRHDPGQALTQYKIDLWQTEQGLPLNTVQCLLQTSDGYLWVGTGGGLARFDGVRFTTFETAQVPELSSQGIFGLMEDAQRNLWIGTSGNAFLRRNGRFERVYGREITSGRRVWSFAQAKDGAVWAATENGLIRWKDRVAKLYGLSDGLPTLHLRAIAIDRDGTIWLATADEGLVSFDGARFASLNPSNGFPHRAVRAVLADPAGGVWAATAGGGLARVQRGQVSVWGVKEGLPTDQLTSLSRDANGSLWIGTWGAGLCRMREGKFTSISTPNGLAGGQLWGVHADREGNIWVGTWAGGLNRLSDREFLVLGTPEGLSHDNVRAVAHARDGSAWVTTAGGGVNRITSDGITVIRQADGLPSDEASSVMEDRDGAIWIGTYTAGVARLKNGRLETFGLAQGVPNVDVRTFYQDRSGTIWAGTMSGLATFNGKAFTAIRAPGAPPEGASVILEDRSGTLWFGTNEGLTRYRNGKYDTLTRANGLLSNWIMSLYEDADGALWIGTNGEGLNRLKNGRISSVRASDGLWDPMVQVILEDRFGNFWMTCNRGFYRVRRKDLDAFCDGHITKVASTGYGPGDALRSTTFAGGLQPAGAVDSEGHLWLPSFSGLVLVDPADLPGSGAPPAVTLERVLVNGVERPLDGPIVLPPGSAPLSIAYTSTTLRVAERVRFRYRMEGSGGGWVDAGRTREAFFPTLPHGKYLFRVGASIDGVHWREIATPLRITVKPHVYETPWFIALAILALVGAVVCAMKWRTRNLQRQKAEMERLVEEKTEELQRVNEHLAQLSFVDSLTGLANRRRFDEALEQEWQRARRFGSPVSVVVADVDLFKPYNDTLGHPEGDTCLAAVGDVLLHTSRRAGDLVARYGGEEFVVLVPGPDKESVVAFAEALRAACEARAIPHPASPVAPIVTISLGVATRIPCDGLTPHALVAEADAALYRAKREGRNRVCS